MAVMAVLASLLLAAPASAQEDGVFIDPDSPSAKEYSLPLESERRQADPEQEPSAGIVQGERSSPIFGTGIVRGDESERARSGSRSTQDDGPDSSRGGRAAAGRARCRDRRGRDIESRAARRRHRRALIIGGVAVGVLLLGGLAGLLLRRRA